MRLAGAIGLFAVLIGAAAIAIWFLQPRGLPSRGLPSVPELLSEPPGLVGGELLLAPDGLGLVTFGEDEASVLATLSEVLGPPIEDGPQPCQSENGVVRWVRWGNLEIALPGGTFTAWAIGVYFRGDSPALDLQTAEGVGLEDGASELAAAYGDRLEWIGQEDSGFSEPVHAFGIDGYDIDRPAPIGLGGYVEGGQESGRVITIRAGQACGPG